MRGDSKFKDAKINEDDYIYMVHEYGEIDLSQILLQKQKEMDAGRKQIDENWLRFYWQVCHLTQSPLSLTTYDFTILIAAKTYS